MEASRSARPLRQEPLRRLGVAWKRELGLPASTAHSLRHGAVTRLLAYDVDLKPISAILGHASAAVTAAIDVNTDEKRKAEAMAEVLGSAFPLPYPPDLGGSPLPGRRQGPYSSERIRIGGIDRQPA